MTTSKSILGLNHISFSLTSGVGALVLETLDDLEKRSPSESITQALHGALLRIKSPVLAFQVRKTLRKISGELAGKPLSADGVSPEAILLRPEKLEETAVVISQVGKDLSPTWLTALRKARWSEWPGRILPTFLRFVGSFGGQEDFGPIRSLLAETQEGPVVESALEALERLGSPDLEERARAFLSSPSPALRGKAARILYRFNPADALEHLLPLLFSENPVEQAIALHHAAGLPFWELECHLLRFVGETLDSDLLMRASPLFCAGATPELTFKLYRVYKTLQDTHRDLVKGLIIQVVLALYKTRQITTSPQDFIDSVREKIASEDLQKAKSIGEETDPQEKPGSPAEPLPSTTPVPPAPLPDKPASPSAFEAMGPHERIIFLNDLPAEGFPAFRGRIPDLLKTTRGKELAAVIRLLGRYGSFEDAALVPGYLDHEDPVVVCAAIDALVMLQPDHLGVFLPKLMQSQKGKIRFHATQAFINLDRQQVRSLVSEMLRSSQPKQRAMAIPICVQVDFMVVRDTLLKALERETSPELIQKMGVLLSSNPDREILRTIFRFMKQQSGQVAEILQDAAQQTAKNLSVIMGKSVPFEELIAEEEKSFQAQVMAREARPPAQAARKATPAEGATGDAEKEARLFRVVVVLIILNWLALAVNIALNLR